ncbi:flagellar basal-body MS-ring/collar protein FliF [Hyphomonas adhaerens]|uniref:flagellar basal-body MS-ring/collar protein FliF n=1 Tax=Hyphomonas adhaerens TaxID=81029 RepID=UPI002352C9A2|nr:flagellar basal-body MS-ring/collar protein FliF [Hyphomonas adhaerens]
MLAVAVLGVVGIMSVMVQGAMKQPMGLLYSGLDASVTGEIIDELDKRGTRYEIKGDAILVPQKDRDSVRFALARDGLPKQSVQGYELLDNVNGFSVTSEMYNAAYWRAKEGELTRTILAVPGIKSARVHIGASLRSGFARSDPAQTASVTLSSAHDLTNSQAQGIQYLVALAVSGLSPDEVAVIDLNKGILAGPGAASTEQSGVAAETQESQLEQKVLRLLEARVGPGNARVSVSVDVSHERQRTSAVTYDPDSRVVRSRTTGDVAESSGGTSGALTVSSNLPQGSAPAGSQSNSTVKNSSESVSYEINETRTETERLPGQVERMSVAVLVNEQVLGLDPAAPDAATINDEMVADFRQLVTSAIGLEPGRGDNLTVEFMPFQAAPVEELATAPGMMEQLMERYFWSGIQILVLGLVVIVLALGVIRPMLKQPKTNALSLDDQEPGSLDAIAADPFASLKDYASERQDDAAAILQEWLDEDRKVAVNE